MNARRNQGPPPRDPILMVVFLGNPGQQYRRTRHNVAWRLCEFVRPSPPESWKEKFNALFVRVDGVFYLLPQTFMNESGRAVQAAAAFFDVPAAQIVVISDDTETPFGTVSLAFGGGHRGQNGIRSIERALGVAGFWRLRIGVGRPKVGDLHSHVLSGFDEHDEAHLDEVFARAEAMLRRALLRPAVESDSISL